MPVVWHQLYDVSNIAIKEFGNHKPYILTCQSGCQNNLKEEARVMDGILMRLIHYDTAV